MLQKPSNSRTEFEEFKPCNCNRGKYNTRTERWFATLMYLHSLQCDKTAADHTKHCRLCDQNRKFRNEWLMNYRVGDKKWITDLNTWEPNEATLTKNMYDSYKFVRFVSK